MHGDEPANERESESSEVSFVLESIGDEPPRLVRSIETHEDGSMIVTEYEDATPADDPYVRTRQRTVGSGLPQEVVTEFLPAPVRPKSYPASFPFLAGRPCWTTESPAHMVSPGARWRCDDPDAVLAALFQACVTEGWTQLPPSEAERSNLPNLVAEFRRGRDVCVFLRIDLGGGSIIQMEELPADWMPELDADR